RRNCQRIRNRKYFCRRLSFFHTKTFFQPRHSHAQNDIFIHVIDNFPVVNSDIGTCFIWKDQSCHKNNRAEYCFFPALYAYRTLCVIFICNPDFQMAVFPIQFFRRNLFSIQDIHCFHGDRKFLFCCPLIKDVLSFCLPCKPVSILRNVLVPFDVFYPVQNTFVSDCSGTLNPFQLFGNGYRFLLSRSICININRFLLTDRIISCIFASCSAHRHRRQHHRHPGRQRRSHFLFPFSVSAHHSFPFLHLKSGCFFLSRNTCRILLLSMKSDGRFAYYTVKNHKHSRKNENYYTHADQCTSCQQRTDRADHINIGICRHTECSRKK